LVARVGGDRHHRCPTGDSDGAACEAGALVSARHRRERLRDERKFVWSFNAVNAVARLCRKISLSLFRKL
jgi:hypothetical protein